MSYGLEVRVPISPTPDYFRRIHFMAAALRRMEDEIGAHLLVICVGGNTEPFDLHAAQPWSRNYPIIWHWADREKFRRESYWETSRDVFRQPVRARVVMFADADVLFVRPFAELLSELVDARAVAGVIAHAPPVRSASSELWSNLARSYGVPALVAVHEYTGWNFMTKERFAPAYFNFGMVLTSASAMDTLGAEIIAADHFVSANLDTFFRHQIALTLAMQKVGLTSRALPLRDNFPNDPRFDKNYPDELARVRVLHYLRCDVVHRENDFRTLAAVKRLIARTDLTGSNELLRKTLAELYPAVAAGEKSAVMGPTR
jgi:hypothetical protein